MKNPKRHTLGVLRSIHGVPDSIAEPEVIASPERGRELHGSGRSLWNCRDVRVDQISKHFILQKEGPHLWGQKRRSRPQAASRHAPVTRFSAVALGVSARHPNLQPA
ncbi:hypothetical protein [Pseudomonas phage vB_Pae_CF74b]|nr:hypothetical protein [Pseudomonas phage vB_Pae_CF57a]QBI80194.1 hypothetical protein [Pseudomonas phage vB_Pae_CF74b]